MKPLQAGIGLSVSLAVFYPPCAMRKRLARAVYGIHGVEFCDCRAPCADSPRPPCSAT